MTTNQIRLKAGLRTELTKPVIGLLVLLLVLRLAFVGLMGPMPQDAYYFFYSQHPALSYFDHPPMIAYLLRGFTFIFGKNVFALKLADTVVSACTCLAFYVLAKKFSGAARARYATLLLYSTLLFTIVSLVSTPDVPLLLFWTLSMSCLYEAIFNNRSIYWIAAGIMMGLAFDSKYTAVFLPAGTMLFLLLSPEHRTKLLKPGPWVSFILFGVTILPVVIWNLQTDFASFKFQSTQRSSGVQIHPTGTLGLILHQAAILLPLLLIAIIWVLYKLIRKYLRRPTDLSGKALFLLCFSVPLIACFLSISWIYWIKLNWLMPAYVGAIVLAAMYSRKKILTPQLWISAVIHVLLAAELLLYFIPIKSDDTWEGWKQLSTKTKAIQEAHPNDFLFAADDYKTSAELGLYLNGPVYSKNVLGLPALQYDFVGTDLNALKGKNALFLNSIPNFKNPDKENIYPAELNDCFDRIQELEPILIKRGDRVIRKFLVFECFNYRGPKKKAL